MTGRYCKRKMLGMLAAGCLLFQLGGCGFEGLWNRFQIGFGEQLGAFAASVMIDAFGLEDAAGGICFSPACQTGGE